MKIDQAQEKYIDFFTNMQKCFERDEFTRIKPLIERLLKDYIAFLNALVANNLSEIEGKKSIFISNLNLIRNDEAMKNEAMKNSQELDIDLDDIEKDVRNCCHDLITSLKQDGSSLADFISYLETKLKNTEINTKYEPPICKTGHKIVRIYERDKMLISKAMEKIADFNNALKNINELIREAEALYALANSKFENQENVDALKCLIQACEILEKPELIDIAKRTYLMRTKKLYHDVYRSLAKAYYLNKDQENGDRARGIASTIVTQIKDQIKNNQYQHDESVNKVFQEISINQAILYAYASKNCKRDNDEQSLQDIVEAIQILRSLPQTGDPSLEEEKQARLKKYQIRLVTDYLYMIEALSSRVKIFVSKDVSDQESPMITGDGEIDVNNNNNNLPSKKRKLIDDTHESNPNKRMRITDQYHQSLSNALEDTEVVKHFRQMLDLWNDDIGQIFINYYQSLPAYQRLRDKFQNDQMEEDEILCYLMPYFLGHIATFDINHLHSILNKVRDVVPKEITTHLQIIITAAQYHQAVDVNEDMRVVANTLLHSLLKNREEEGNSIYDMQINFSCLNMKNIILNGLDLSTVIFENTNLEGANLSSSIISCLRNANLADADLSFVDSEDANMLLCNLTNANLDNATLAGVRLRSARLYQVSLLNTDLSRADLTGAQFIQPDLYEQPFIFAPYFSSLLINLAHHKKHARFFDLVIDQTISYFSENHIEDGNQLRIFSIMQNELVKFFRQKKMHNELVKFFHQAKIELVDDKRPLYFFKPDNNDNKDAKLLARIDEKISEIKERIQRKSGNVKQL